MIDGKIEEARDEIKSPCQGTLVSVSVTSPKWNE
jgi:hypothetical protein